MPEDKTRVLNAAESAGLMVGEPRFVGGKVIFQCSNGHRLVVAVEHAGKRGRCDKEGCGVAVVIPSPPATEPPSVITEAVDEEEPLSAVEAPEAIPAGLPPVAPFMPQVAVAPVVVPPLAASEPDDTVDVGPPLPAVAEPAAPVNGAAGWQFGGPVAAPPAAAAEPGGETAVAWGGFAADEAAGEVAAEDEADDNPTARLVARLWLEREHGGIVELHLAGGSVILPEWYEKRWSRGTHGLFASQSADGSITLTAVAWDAIQKVVVRQVQGLPDGMFE